MAVYGIGENKCLKEVLTKDDVYTKDNFIYIDKLFQIKPNVQGTYVLTADDLKVATTTHLMVISHMTSMDGNVFYPVREMDTNSSGTIFNRVRIRTDDDEVIINYGHTYTYKTSIYVKVALMRFDSYVYTE